MLTQIVSRLAFLLVTTITLMPCTAFLPTLLDQARHHRIIELNVKFLGKNDGRDSRSKAVYSGSVCRVVASSDGKLPLCKSDLPDIVKSHPSVLDKLDMLYHAISHEEARKLKYLETTVKNESRLDHEEESVVSFLRTSLEDAGFQRLTQRDLDLCEALNAGYLLRLSIQPEVSDLDPSITAEFYPEHINNTAMVQSLFCEGRVLVYRRGYSSEITKGRLLLPKIDYLQASLVQGSAFKVTQKLGQFERVILDGVERFVRFTRMRGKALLHSFTKAIPIKSLQSYIRESWGWNRLSYSQLKEEIRNKKKRSNFFFRLDRYGGPQAGMIKNPAISDALTPFLVCELNYDTPETGSNGVNNTEAITHDIYQHLNQGDYTCQYDSEHPEAHHKGPKPSTLLKRISIGNVVDIFSPLGRQRMVSNFLSTTELVEPTYEELVVVWRPLRKTPKTDLKLRIPKAVYDAAEIFDLEDKLPDKGKQKQTPLPPALEVRAFTSVPMSNLPGVFPKTRLVLRPADAFLFDLISVFTLLVVLGSRRFDSPRLDLLALISVSLWIIRTVLRYSNKLARYDLLVKKFLTSKIAHRDAGAIKYIANEAASQRATRAALVHAWLLSAKPNRWETRTELIEEGYVGVNEMLDNDQYIDIDVEAGLKDLEELRIVSFSDAGKNSFLLKVADKEKAVDLLKSSWVDIFEATSTRVAMKRRLPLDLRP